MFVALVDLVDVHTCDGQCSPWAVPDRWHYVLHNPSPVPPIPARGQLTIWQVAPSLLLRLGL